MSPETSRLFASRRQDPHPHCVDDEESQQLSPKGVQEVVDVIVRQWTVRIEITCS